MRQALTAQTEKRVTREIKVTRVMPEKRATKEIKATRAMPVRTAAVRGIFMQKRQ